MIYHILNGDSLAQSFPAAEIEGDLIVVREALINGDLSGGNLIDFWISRARYLGTTPDDYHHHVSKEFDKIINAPDGAEFNLWFEYDLFCQVNMWFVISLLNSLPGDKKVYVVYSSYLNKNDPRFWNGFGQATPGELQICFANRMLLHDYDLQFGQNLWQTYQRNDLEELNHLAKNHSPALPNLPEVVRAHAERFPTNYTDGRPERVLKEIIQKSSADFHQVCKEFWARESIYGFGDTQLKELYDKVLRS